jgi:hypothetical protein
MAVFDAMHALSQQLNIPLPSHYSIPTEFAAAAGFLIVGLILTLGAGALTRLAYGAPK